MKAFCQNCEAITEQEFIQAKVKFIVNGDCIPVRLKYYPPLKYGTDYRLPQRGSRQLQEAYHKLGFGNSSLNC